MMPEFNNENNHLYIKAQEICQKIEQIEKTVILNPEFLF
jgi:hypothetical protein